MPDMWRSRGAGRAGSADDGGRRTDVARAVLPSVPRGGTTAAGRGTEAPAGEGWQVMATVHLTLEEAIERIRERLADMERLQQRAHLVEASRLLNACEAHDVDGAVWDATMRLTDTVNHLGGFLADAQKLAAALERGIREAENGGDDA